MQVNNWCKSSAKETLFYKESLARAVDEGIKQELWGQEDLSSYASNATYYLCDPGQVT